MSKKRFLIFGFFNILITNLILQISLFFLQIFLATFISQIAGTLIGFYLYGKFVFRNSSLSINKLMKYFISTLIIWILNWFGIYFLSTNGINKNVSALLLVPLLASFSYVIQKKRVFV